MEEVERQRQVGVELRRYPRYRVSAPFPCAFSLLGLKRWTAVDRNGLGDAGRGQCEPRRQPGGQHATPGDCVTGVADVSTVRHANHRHGPASPRDGGRVSLS